MKSKKVKLTKEMAAIIIQKWFRRICSSKERRETEKTPVPTVPDEYFVFKSDEHRVFKGKIFE